MKYTVYGKSPCPYCRMAVDMLNRHGLDFAYVSTSPDGVEALQTLMRNSFGVEVKTFPVITLDDGVSVRFIGGYEDLKDSLTPVEEIDFDN